MPNSEQRIAESFARMGLMRTLGAELVLVTPGEVHIAIWPKPDITQHHGFVHAGALTAVADTGCGYAAMTLGPEGSEVLTVEFKVNFLRPATAERFIAKATVVKPGRSLSVCQCDVLADDGEREISVALMQCTIMTVPA